MKKSFIAVSVLALGLAGTAYAADTMPGDPLGTGKVINNNATPFGGPTGCPWPSNNCGPNDEIFSFHTGGALVVFADGHVQFVRDSIAPAQVRYMVTAADGDIVIDN